MYLRTAAALAAASVFVAMAVTSASLWQEPTYEASARVWVEPGGIDPTVNRAGVRTLIPTAINMKIDRGIDDANGRPLAEGAIQSLGLGVSPNALLDGLTIGQIEGTNFVRLDYKDANPHEARRIANALAEVFSERITETGAGSPSGDLTATVLVEASTPDSPVSPNPLMNGLLALVGD